jgi:O-antigen ligase
MLLLDGSPEWARAPSDRLRPIGRYAPPANPASFARFARRVAERYGDQVRYYQIWDEPNIAPHWGSRHIEPVNYARLLKAASTAIRDTDAGAYILAASLAPTEDRGHLALDEGYFLNRLYAAGAAPYFDAVAIQPFGFGNRPDDADVDRRALNFRRTLLIRQVMLDAGDGDTPLWLLSFGWNRALTSPWRSVTPENQAAFTLDALEMAYRRWPWVAAMGWPAATLPPDHALAGFALTPELAGIFHTASTELLTERRAQRTPTPPLSLWTAVALWWLAILALIWRAGAAARQLPWARWRAAWIARPAWQQAVCWLLLLFVYYLAVWPPLLLLCALIASLGFLAQPRFGLTLALLFLPFYDYHKEFDWLGQRWLLPPTQAVLLCLVPSIWCHRPYAIPRDRWLGLALAWPAIMLLAAGGVWNWQAYTIGMLNLVIIPLSLFLLVRAWATTPQDSRAFVVALAAGGIFITEIGLFDWLQGNGTFADGMRRLTGIGFSSNHTALYLIRTVAITLGLMLASRGRTSAFWAFWSALITVALFLTGSRGAILLGIPAGALFVFSRQNLPLPDQRRLLGLSLVVGIALAVLAWMWRDRLANLGTMVARLDGWIVALALWRDHFLFGVGPDGFWWSFPAEMWLSSDADPNLRHPHNIWLELATSGGLSALIWLGAAGVLLYRWVRARQNALTWVQIGLLTALIAGFAHAQVDAFQALSELAGWNWAALALLLAPHDASEQKSSE